MKVPTKDETATFLKDLEDEHDFDTCELRLSGEYCEDCKGFYMDLDEDAKMNEANERRLT